MYTYTSEQVLYYNQGVAKPLKYNILLAHLLNTAPFEKKYITSIRLAVKYK